MVERINFSSDLNGAKFNDSIYFSLIVSWDSICIPDCIADVPNSTFYNSPFQNDILIVNGDSLNLITVVSSKNRMSNYVELRIPTYSCLKSDTETMKLYCNNIMNHGELLHMESYGKLKEISKSTSFDILYIRSAFEHDFFEIKTFPPWEKFPKFITFE
ncbi:MAG: hypothetical protein H6607_09465 [Flavobacteriales bacterium]|nr:hypothetical protein [Flavobacteriales bacterium]